MSSYVYKFPRSFLFANGFLTLQENILLQYLAPYVDGITRATLENSWNKMCQEDGPVPVLSRGP